MTHPFNQRRLADILLDKQFIEPAQVETILASDSKNEAGWLGEQLLEANLIEEAQLAEALSEMFHLDYVDLGDFSVPPVLFDVLGATQSYQMGVLPFAQEGNHLTVAVADPFDVMVVDRLERITGLQVHLVLSTASAIRAALKRSEGTSAVLHDISRGFRPVIVKETEEGHEETIMLDAVDEASAPVVRLINSILMAAMQKRASDVHIEIYEEGISVKYRIDGVLYPATEMLDPGHHSAVISRLKVMAELDIAEKRVPQDGRFKLRLNRRDIDFRVSILPGVFGEDVVIRVLDKYSITDDLHTLSLDTLGIASETLSKFRKAIREPYGMVLITGPTGSGKTTTLYAALSELNSGEEKIITIEDPVEYQLDGIVQIPVNEKKQLTFAKGLRSILRHDPDKVMVGEIRDADTAQIAVQSALTGHLVFTTVHANNAFDVIGRFSHMGIDVYGFVSALNCVMAQRLARKICPNCRRESYADRELLEQSGLNTQEYAKHLWQEGAGCSHCNGTGYRGRAAITELLDLSARIRDMIIERRSVSELAAVAMEEGMVTLRQSALRMALAGETTLKEINRVTFVD